MLRKTPILKLNEAFQNQAIVRDFAYILISIEEQLSERQIAK